MLNRSYDLLPLVELLRRVLSEVVRQPGRSAAEANSRDRSSRGTKSVRFYGSVLFIQEGKQAINLRIDRTAAGQRFPFQRQRYPTFLPQVAHPATLTLRPAGVRSCRSLSSLQVHWAMTQLTSLPVSLLISGHTTKL
jgi:hypothetical protein